MKKSLTYISYTAPDGEAGQSTFEYEIISTLLRELPVDIDFKAFSGHLGPHKFNDSRVVQPSFSKSILGYLLLDLRMFFSLLRRFLFLGAGEHTVFIRYHPGMFSPLILLYLFPFRLIVRSGPVLQNIGRYKPNMPRMLCYGIAFIGGKFLSRAERIIAVTSTIRDHLVETYKLPPEKFVVIPNAVNVDMWVSESADPAQRKSLGLRDESFVLGYVGSLYREQGLQTVLKAMAILKERGHSKIQVLVIGDGEMAAELKQFATANSLGDVIVWTGWVSREKVPGMIACCDMMLLPITREGFAATGSSAIKLYEYLSCDKPVLASRADDHNFIEQNTLGILVNPDDPQAWATAIEQVSQVPLRLMGKGTRYANSHHSYKALVNRIVELFSVNTIKFTGALR